MSRWYGSLQNRLMENVPTPQLPSVGDGCTILCWSDRVACTVVELLPDGFVIQRDRATRLDPNGMSESQTYHYESDADGVKHTIRRVRSGRLKGQFRVDGLSDGNGVKLYDRDEYYDFSF
jgi:hypothetical protein